MQVGYTVYHTENSNHLDQNIGIIWHKRSMLVKDNTAEYIVSQENRNYHETIYDGAIGIKETFEDSSMGMKNLLVGFLKQAKNRVIDIFDATPSRANFLTTLAFSKTVWD